MGEEGKVEERKRVSGEAQEKDIEIQSAAEERERAWSTPSLSTPKLSSVIPSIPKPSVATKTAPIVGEEGGVRTWKTGKLGLRVGVDALAAGAAGVLVAPIITMIDKGIIENASGRNTLGESLKNSTKELLLRPHRFLMSRPFALIFVRPNFPPSNYLASIVY